MYTFLLTYSIKILSLLFVVYHDHNFIDEILRDQKVELVNRLCHVTQVMSCNI